MEPSQPIDFDGGFGQKERDQIVALLDAESLASLEDGLGIRDVCGQRLREGVAQIVFFGVQSARRSGATPQRVKKQLAAIVKASRALMDAIEDDDSNAATGEALFQITIQRGAIKLDEIYGLLEDLVRLEISSSKAIEVIRGNGRPRNLEMPVIVIKLSDLLFEITGKRYTVKKDNYSDDNNLDKYSGPLLEVLCIVDNAIAKFADREPLSRATLRGFIERHAPRSNS